MDFGDDLSTSVGNEDRVAKWRSEKDCGEHSRTATKCYNLTVHREIEKQWGGLQKETDKERSHSTEQVEESSIKE